MAIQAQKDHEILISAQIFVSGRVQGVGFRKFSHDCATRLHLCGTVQNLADGRVALTVEGKREQVEGLVTHLREGPPASRVDGVEVLWLGVSERLSTFSIIT